MAVDTEPRDTQKETANDVVSTSATEVPNDEPLPSPFPSPLPSPLPNSSAEVLPNNVPFDFDSYISDLFPGTELLRNNLPDTDPLSNVEHFVFPEHSQAPPAPEMSFDSLDTFLGLSATPSAVNGASTFLTSPQDISMPDVGISLESNGDNTIWSGSFAWNNFSDLSSSTSSTDLVSDPISDFSLSQFNINGSSEMSTSPSYSFPQFTESLSSLHQSSIDSAGSLSHSGSSATRVNSPLIPSSTISGSDSVAANTSNVMPVFGAAISNEPFILSNQKQQKPAAFPQVSTEASASSSLDASREQLLRDIPRPARSRKPTGSREVKTLVDAEKSPPSWQVQSLAAMRDPTFGDIWSTVLDKWDTLEVILSREKNSVRSADSLIVPTHPVF